MPLFGTKKNPRNQKSYNALLRLLSSRLYYPRIDVTSTYTKFISGHFKTIRYSI